MEPFPPFLIYAVVDDFKSESDQYKASVISHIVKAKQDHRLFYGYTNHVCYTIVSLVTLATLVIL